MVHENVEPVLIPNQNLAKLDDGLDESQTVMVVDKTKNRKILAKIGAYLNPVGLSLRPMRPKLAKCIGG
jgi:hypothetical protein